MLHAVIMFITLVLSCQSVHAQQPTKPDRYSIKADHPSVGLFKENVATGDIPFNKRYAELTPEQQQRVKALYERLEEGDEPPFPANGLRPIYKALADATKHMDWPLRGDLLLYVDVDSEGRATSVMVMQTPDERINRYAAAVAMREKYKPALCKGAPCKMQFPVAARFQ